MVRLDVLECFPVWSPDRANELLYHPQLERRNSKKARFFNGFSKHASSLLVLALGSYFRLFRFVVVVVVIVLLILLFRL